MQYNIENKTLICIGDVHGEFSRLRFKLAQYIKKYGLTDTIFIVCGDCGFFEIYRWIRVQFHAL